MVNVIPQKLFMKMFIKNLKVTPHITSGVGLSFETSYQAIDKLNQLSNEKQYELIIEDVKKKRSNAQNSYLWALLSEISKAENGNDSETENIYIELLTEAGAKVDYILALPETENTLRQVFRTVVKVDERNYNGKAMNMYKCFAGSSTFDTKEMNILIDKTLQRAYEDGLETEYWRELLKG